MPSTVPDARQITRRHAARTVLDAVDCAPARTAASRSSARTDRASPPCCASLLEVLEAALESWSGALVLATHDRTLREALRLDREIAL